MICKFAIPTRVSNSQDNLHCLQAVLSMSVETLTGRFIDSLESEQITGFRPDMETWSYQMLAWLGQNGFDVVHIDALDPESFLSSPRDEFIRCGLDADTIDYYFKISDFDAESESIRRCLDAGVVFHSRIPQIADIADSLADGWLPMVSLDASVLTAETRDGFQGHIVLVTGSDPEHDVYRVQDSGPPARWDWDVPGDLLVKSMRTPADSSGTVTLVRRRIPPQNGGSDGTQ